MFIIILKPALSLIITGFYHNMKEEIVTIEWHYEE